MRRPPIRYLDVAGAPGDIGAAHGSAHAEEIRRYTRDRVALVASSEWRGGPLSESDVLDIAESMVASHEAFDPALHIEMSALAGAAGISLAEAIVVGGFTDFVDTVRAEVGGRIPANVVEDDCTAVIVPDTRSDGAGFLAQTWDMHDLATEHVILLRIRPDDGPAATVFTTTGCLGQIGMNREGVCVGINNLHSLDGRPGVTWTSVVRAMLKTTTAAEALDVLLAADLAGAHNYLIFDRHGDGYSVEAMPSIRPVDRLTSDPIVHTNHTVDHRAGAVQATRDPVLQKNSQARLDRARELLSEGPIDEERLFAMTRDEEAICQVAHEPFHIETSGAAVMRPRTGDFWACAGRTDCNDYQHVSN